MVSWPGNLKSVYSTIMLYCLLGIYPEHSTERQRWKIRGIKRQRGIELRWPNEYPKGIPGGVNTGNSEESSSIGKKGGAENFS